MIRDPIALFLSDEPITQLSQDLLGRSRVVDQLIRSITGWTYPTALVIGLYGEWGEGKTSIKNLVCGELRQLPDYQVVEIDPWYFNSADAFIQDFLIEILSAVSNRRRKALGKQVEALRKALASSPSFSAFGFGVDLSRIGPRHPTLEGLSNQLKKELAKREKRLIVTIDDLDRLPVDDLRIMLKLVKLFASLSDCVFILPFDPRIIAGKLGDEASGDPKFLQKIVQVSIDLPAIDQAAVGEFIDSHIEELARINSLTFEPDFSKRLGEMWRSGIKFLIADLRGAKRYLNALAFSIPLVRGEVNYADFFAIEAIRLNAPELYANIQSNQHHFTEGTGQIMAGRQLEANRAAYFDSIEGSLDQDPTHRRAIMAILSDLFPRLADHPRGTQYGVSSWNDWSKNQRITTDRCFGRYFRWSLNRFEYSDEKLRGVIGAMNETTNESAQEMFGELIKQARQRKTVKLLLQSLRLFHSDIAETAGAVIASDLGRDRSQFSAERGFLETNEFDLAVLLVLDLAENLKGSPSIQEYLESVVNYSEVVFAARVVYYIRDDRGNPWINSEYLDSGSLAQRFRDRVTATYFETGRDIISEEGDWAIHVLYVANDKAANTRYLQALLEQPSSLQSFLERYVRDRPYSEAEVQLDSLTQIVNLRDFAKFATGVPLPDDADRACLAQAALADALTKIEGAAN